MGILIVLFMAIAISSYEEQSSSAEKKEKLRKLSDAESEEKDIRQSAVVSDICGISMILTSNKNDEIKNILSNADKIIVFSIEKSSDDILKLLRQYFGTEKEIKPLGRGGNKFWDAYSRKTVIEQQYQSPFGLKNYDVCGICTSDIDVPFIEVIKNNKGKIFYVQQKSEERPTENTPSIAVYSQETAPLTVKRF